MIHAAIDHLVVTAPSLASGSAYIRDMLGVELQPGGEHPAMGTHNLLLRLDNSTYLEVLSVNPDATAPGTPRWFGLDNVTSPALATWVARIDDIHAVVAATPDLFGDIQRMSRGSLTWLITIPRDGRLRHDGVTPALIQWLGEPHPASLLPHSGCSLETLSAVHAEAPAISQALNGIIDDPRWSLGAAGRDGAFQLNASINTPSGLRMLGRQS